MTKTGGMRPARLDGLAEQFEQQVRDGPVPGLVALVIQGGVRVKTITRGWQDFDRQVPMQPDTLFRIASMTKPITAVAALVLLEQGKLTLTSPIEEWLPEFSKPSVLREALGAIDNVEPAARSVTVLDLLTHRAGFGYPATLPGPLGMALTDIDADTDGACDPDLWIARLAALPLASQPGARFLYGLASDVLGILIERAAGMPLARFFHDYIFAPLRMDDTAFSVPTSKVDRLGPSYRLNSDGNRVILDSAESSAWMNPGRFASGGGGLVSTADDYARFAEMLLGCSRYENTRVLSPRSVKIMTSDWLTPEQRQVEVFGRRFFAGQGYGLGVSVTDNPARQEDVLGYSSVGSFGWSGIYGTSWLADPVEQLNLIYMSQLCATDFTLSQQARLAKAAYEAMDE